MRPMRRALAAALLLAAGGLASPVGAGAPRPCTPAEMDLLTRGLPGTSPPPGLADCVGMAPGALYRTINRAGRDQYCTAGFVFRGSDSRTYMTTSGRCLLSTGECVQDELPLPVPLPQLPLCVVLFEEYSDEEPVYKAGKGMPVRDRYGRRIGEWAYAVYQEGRDFGLIRIDPRVPVSPRVCHWGGPTGLDQGVRTMPEQFLHVSDGNAVQGVALRGLYDAHRVEYIAGGFGGNHGLAMTTDGRIIGGTMYLSLFGTVLQRYGPTLTRAQGKTRTHLTLQTAPLAP